MIETLLLEMKDTSELMIDLAYSSLLYNSHEIAEEVFNLEEEIDELNQSVQRTAINSVLDDKNVDKALVILRLANSIEAVADSALEIADVVLRGIEPHPIFKMSIDESDIIILRSTVNERSKLIDKTLGEVHLATVTGMWVIAIKRGKRWIYGPDESTQIDANDLLFVRGPVEGKAEFFKMLGCGEECEE